LAWQNNMSNIKRFISFGFAIMIVLSIIVWFIYAPDRELEKYKISSPLKQLKEEQVNKVLDKYVGKSFWKLNIEKIHSDLVHVDWVYKAEVIRKWPNALIVKLEEQVPVVRWGDNALLNQSGDVFYPYHISEFSDYVVLRGEDVDAKKMLAKLVVFQEKFNPLNWVIKQVDKRVDKGWLIKFVTGQEVIVGREGWESILDRFIISYPKVKKRIRNNAQVYDLRYSDGFVVKILDKEVIAN